MQHTVAYVAKIVIVTCGRGVVRIMFLSVIIPVYNCQDWLRDCLDSCFDQDIEPNDYEVICINDGSPDKSLSILEEYKSDHGNMIIIDQPNAGQLVAIKNGINVAKGEYIWFVDSDDFIKQNCLSKLKNTSNNDYDIINFSGKKFEEDIPRTIFMGVEENAKTFNYHGFRFLHIFRRELFNRFDFDFFSNIYYGEDEMMIIALKETAESEFTLNEFLYYYRQRQNSVMGKLNYSIEARRKRMDDIILSMIILREKILRGQYSNKFTITVMRERYTLSVLCLSQFGLKEKNKYLNQFTENHLFDKDIITVLNAPDKKTFKRQLAFRRMIVFLSKVSALLPSPIINFIKKLLKIK